MTIIILFGAVIAGFAIEVMLYPVYRKLGGRKTFEEYIDQL